MQTELVDMKLFQYLSNNKHTHILIQFNLCCFFFPFLFLKLKMYLIMLWSSKPYTKEEQAGMQIMTKSFL